MYARGVSFVPLVIIALIATGFAFTMIVYFYSDDIFSQGDDTPSPSDDSFGDDSLPPTVSRDDSSNLDDTNDRVRSGGSSRSGGGGGGGGGSGGDSPPLPVMGNVPPVALFQVTSGSGVAPLDTHFDASNSFDSDGQIVLYEWDFDGDGIVDSQDAQPLTSHVFSSVGLYPTVLTVYDDRGASDREVFIVSVIDELQQLSQVSQYGITWFFDRTYRTGQFANGDWWVVPDNPGEAVVITQISPSSQTILVNNTPKQVHGWEVNPDSTYLQAFDERQHGLGIDYDPSRLPSLPYAAHAGESIVKAISNLSDVSYSFGYYRFPLERAAILTVLDDVPEDNGLTVLRPPYYGNDKPSYSLRSLSFDALPSVEPPEGSYISLQTIVDELSPPQLDHFKLWLGAHMHPTLNGPGYGRDLAYLTHQHLTRLLLNDSLRDKLPALIIYTQYGTDLYQMFSHNVTWEANGGYAVGRKMPLVMTSLLFNDTIMQQALMTASSTPLGWDRGYDPSHQIMTFDEDGQFYRSSQTGEVLLGTRNIIYGDPIARYWDVTYNYNSNFPDPYEYIDGGWAPGDSYHLLRVQAYKADALIQRLIPDVQRVWNHDLLLDYLIRWTDEGVRTLPDICAPITGTCSGGANEGAFCTTGTDLPSDRFGYCQGTYCNSVCTGNGTCDSRTRFTQDYGVAYGPDPLNSSLCIFDTNSSDGLGRFPLVNGTAVDGGQLHINLVDALWNSLEPLPSPPLYEEDDSMMHRVTSFFSRLFRR